MVNIRKEIIFLDLDGTILDVSDRIYNLYKLILKSNKKNFLSKKEYINLKQNKTDNKIILAKTKAKDILNDFNTQWKEKIEEKDFLALDKVSIKTRKILAKLKKQYRLVLVTLRDNSKNLKWELKTKNIDKMFDNVLSISGNKDKLRYITKYKLIKNYKGKNKFCIVGDTETDILAGKKAKIKTIAVISGMRSADFLKKYNPDCSIKNFWSINGFFKYNKTK